MKLSLILGGAIATLAAAPVAGQHMHPMPPAVPAVQATPAGPADPIIIQANPTGPGVPTATPPNPAAASDPVPPALPADATYQAGPYKGALTPPPAEAFNKVYPVCTHKRQDSCRNSGGK